MRCRPMSVSSLLPLIRTAAALAILAVLGSAVPAAAQQSDVVLATRPTAPAPQTPVTGPLSFEVASIKPSAAERGKVGIRIAPGGRFTASGLTAKMLIQQAYDIKDFQISGGPGWLSSERYDIVAKAESSANREQLKLMLQSLLAERFKLEVHRETKELPVYSLVVAKNGPKLQKSEYQPPDPESGPPPKPTGEGPGPLARAAAGESVSRSTGGPMMRMGRGQVNAQMAQISMLANVLSMQLGRPVIDKTGLKGAYDFKLEWTPDESQRAFGLGEGDRPAGEAAAPPDSSGPSIFTALQEQLGLKLESQKGPVEILVIDGIEKPSEN